MSGAPIDAPIEGSAPSPGAVRMARHRSRRKDGLRCLTIELRHTGRQLAEMIGVTTQQVHKYETGADGVSAGMMYVIAQALETPISYFFEELGGQTPVGQRERLRMEFAHSFREIENEKHQQAIGHVIRQLMGRPAQTITNSARFIVRGRHGRPGSAPNLCLPNSFVPSQ